MDIGFIVLGAAGKIGSRIIGAIGKLSFMLDGCGSTICPHLLACVDLKFKKDESRDVFAANTLRNCPNTVRDSPPTKLFSDSSPAYKYARSSFGENRTIIYDATSTESHAELFKDFMDAQRKYRHPLSWRYVSEKPLFIERETLGWAGSIDDNQHFYCDFIETVNPVFERMLSHVSNHKLRLRHLWFWRAGSIGIEKALGHSDRSGVTGGAWLDKSAHDVGLAFNIIHSRLPYPSFEFIEPPRSLGVIPHPDYPNEIFNVVDDNFSRIISEAEYSRDSEYAKLFPADAVTWVRCAFKSTLRPGERAIPVTFLSSWVGMTDCEEEQKFTRNLDTLGLSRNVFLLQHERGEFLEQEIRLAIIECEEETLVCNFLTKPEGNVHRFLYVKPKSGDGYYLIEPQFSDTTNEHQKLLLRLINIDIHSEHSPPHPGSHLTFRPQESLLGRYITVESHKFLLQAKEEATKSLRGQDFKDLYTESVELINRKRLHRP